MDERQEILHELEALNLGSCLRIKEMLLMLEGTKPACRIIANDSRLNGLKTFCGKHGLFLEKSSFKTKWTNDASKGGWHTESTRVPPDSEDGSCYCYISGNRKKAERAREAEEFNKSEEFGRILGYPDCCRNFFCAPRDWREIKKSGISGDFVLLTLKGTREDPPYNFYNNFVSQYFGFSLLSHFPCSFNCRKSAELAGKYLKTLKKYSEKLAQNFINYQKSAIVFTERSGIFLIKNFVFKKNSLVYDNSKIKYTLENEILKSLKQGDNIEILNKNHAIIKKSSTVLHEINGKDTGIMVFG